MGMPAPKERREEVRADSETSMDPPPVGCMKFNVDVAMSKNSNTGATVVVARDENGMFLGSSIVVFSSVSYAK
jgi:hypothetical protein